MLAGITWIKDPLVLVIGLKANDTSKGNEGMPGASAEVISKTPCH